LRKAVLTAAIQRELAFVSDSHVRTYLTALVEHDLGPGLVPVRTHMPWSSECTCGASEAEDCHCAAYEYLEGEREINNAPAQPIVEVALVAKQPVPPVFEDVVRAKPADTHPVSKNGHAPKTSEPDPFAAQIKEIDDEEAAAREWIKARAASSASKIEGVPRIDIEEFARFIGWGRGRCQQFVSLVLDEIWKSQSLGKSIVALNEAIHADDEDDDLAEVAFPANAENAAGVPGYITRAGYANMQEYSSGKAAEKAARVKGETFNQSDWLRKYRAKKAIA
jgi:hypothetical protein